MEKINVRATIIKDALQFRTNKYIRSAELKEEFNIDSDKRYKNVINYLIQNRYLVRIFRGFFYIPSLKERKYGLTLNIYEAIFRGMADKGIVNWYFGLHTALKLNSLTHEYFDIIEILSDTVRKSDPIHILDHRVKYIMIKTSLCEFGVETDGFLRYSDSEKTILDMIYLGKKRGLKDQQVLGMIADYIDRIDIPNIKRYLDRYPRSVERIIKEVE